jgi:DNA-binding transcriptional ArsR family regulator
MGMPPAETAAVFAALGDPTRLAVMDAVLVRGGATATQLALDFEVSRQAIVKHLQVLSRAGLVVGERRGSEVVYVANPGGLSPATAWVRQRQQQWSRRLGRLADQVRSGPSGARGAAE